MPELPEAEIVRAGLERFARGRRIEHIDVLRPQTLRRQGGGAAELSGLSVGRTIEAVVRRGKFIWWELSDGVGLGIHLGMSGQFRVLTDPTHDEVLVASAEPASAPRWRQHVRARIRLDDGTTLAFVDQRMFGYLLAVDMEPTVDGHPGGYGTTSALLPPHVAHISRDLLDPHLDLAAVLARLARTRSPIKAALLNQEIVSGLGNIYVDEALWRSRVRYTTPSDELAQPVLETILSHATDVLRESLAQGGTSFDALYVNVNGESGYFSRSLAVYGRADEPCLRCGALLIRERFANRSSFLCPVCQARPGGAG